MLVRVFVSVTFALGMSVRVRVRVAFLTVETRAAFAAHKTVPAKIRDFERRHLACDLPELASKENGGPGELERGPESDGDEEGVSGGEFAE